MKIYEFLTEARKLIDSVDTWCAGSFARTKNGTPCQATYKGAASWCAVGALMKIPEPGINIRLRSHIELNKSSIKLYNIENISRLNDADFPAVETHSYDKVLSVYDDAIARCQEANI